MKMSLKQILIIIFSAFLVNVCFNISGISGRIQRMEESQTKSVLAQIVYPVESFANTIKLTEPREMLIDGFQSLNQAPELSSDQQIGMVIQDEQPTESAATVDTTKNEDIVYSHKRPLRLLLVGDSMMGPGFGNMLIKYCETDSQIAAKRFHKNSTGLTRMDYFDWYAQISKLFREGSYDAVVVMIGTNDAQGYKAGDVLYQYGTEAWDSMYRTRVSSFLDSLVLHTKHVFWLGMPAMKSPRFDISMRKLTKIVNEELGKESNTTFIPTITLLGNSEDQFTTYGSFGKKQVKLREDDGIHLTNEGGKMVTELLISVIKKKFRFE